MFGTLLFGQGPIGIAKPIIIGNWLEIIGIESRTKHEVSIGSQVLSTLDITSDCLREISITSIATIPNEVERNNIGD